MRDKSLVMLLTGSAGGGKSRLAAEKVHAFCKKYPDAMGLMMRKNRQSMNNSTVLFFARTVVGDDPGVRHVSSKHRFEYANGSILAYGGMADDEQREQIRSIGQDGGVDIVWMEEANRFSEDDFNEVLGRVRGKAAGWRQVILSTNPDAPSHWIKKRLMDGGEGRVFFSGAKENRHNPAEYLGILGMLTGVLGERLNKGKWIQAEGAVYEGFRDDLHVVDPFRIPSTWRRIRAIDFGFTNPFACIWLALDPDGRMYLYREIYQTKRLVEDHAKEIIRLSGAERFEATVADHDAEDRATLHKHGVQTIPAQKAISPGLQAVTQRLQVAGDGKPRLFIFRNALVAMDTALPDGLPHCTLDEFGAYSWPKGQDGKAVKETPVDMYNHSLDALRYGIAHIDGLGVAPATASSQAVSRAKVAQMFGQS